MRIPYKECKAGECQVAKMVHFDTKPKYKACLIKHDILKVAMN